MQSSFYTKEEESIIRQYFDPFNVKESCTSIKNKYFANRTVLAIENKARKMGLHRPLKERLWTKGEDEIVKNNAEIVPVTEIYRKLKLFWNRCALPHRSLESVRFHVKKMGFIVSCEGEHYNPVQLAECFGVSTKIIQRWLKHDDMVGVLQPLKTESNRIYIHVKNIREFIKQFPGEIEKTRPSFLWLHDIIFTYEPKPVYEPLGINCPHCNSNQVIRNGKTKNSGHRYKCSDCNKQFTDNTLKNINKLEVA